MADDYSDLGFIPEEKKINAGADDYSDLGFIPTQDKAAGSPALTNLDKAKQALSKSVINQKPEDFELGRFGRDLADTSVKTAEVINNGRRRALSGISQLTSGWMSPDNPLRKVDEYIFGTPEQNKALDTEFDKKYGDNPIASLLSGASEMAPSFIAGGAVNAAKAPLWAANLAKNSGRLGKVGANILGVGAKNAALGTGIGSTIYDPTYERSLGEKALYGGIGGAITGGVSGALSAFNPAIQGANLNKVNLRRVNEALRNSATPLGNAINSPGLKRLQENVLANIPGSGVRGTFQKVNTQLEEEGQGILKNLLGKNPEQQVQDQLRESLMKSKTTVRNLKNKYYNEANDMAEKAGVKITPLNYQAEARKILENDTIKGFPELSDHKITNLLYKAAGKEKTLIPEESKLILPPQLKQEADKRLAENAEKAFTPKSEQTFKDINIIRGKLNNAIKKANRAEEDNQSRVYHRLKDALDKDRNEAIANSNVPAIQDKFAKAQEFYGKDYAPFKDPEVGRFLDNYNKVDTDTLVNFFVRTGKNDRSNLVSKLMDKLPENEKKLVGYQYLANATKMDEGTGSLTFNPEKMANLYNKLGPKQKTALFPDKQTRNQLDNYLIKVSKNREGLNKMLNPKTGQRVSEFLIPSILGGAGGAYLGHNQESTAAGALLGLGGSAVAARALNKILTSPTVRQKLIELITKGGKPPSTLRNAITGGIAGNVGNKAY